MLVESPVYTRGRGWAVISLRDTGADLVVSDLHNDFIRHAPHGRFFFPAVSHGLVDTANPLSSYVFMVRTTEADVLRLLKSQFVASVLRDGTGRPATVTDAELATTVRAQPRAYVRAGQHVQILTGDWSGLDGEVVSAAGGRVVVRVTLCSATRDLTVERQEVKVLR